jgi:NitT/TauT family transport system permease protein
MGSDQVVGILAKGESHDRNRGLRLVAQDPWLVPIAAVIALALWQAVTWLGEMPSFILPSPVQVLNRFVAAMADGSLLRHTAVTLAEVLGGLALGLTTAIGLGYWLARSRRAEKLLSPYIVASQSIPVVAIAPLLVIWFGPGMFSKILISALIIFFPVLVNTIVGLRSVPEELRDLMRSLRATRWQTFRLLEVPAALPVLFGGLKVGATLAVIGAVVGEFVGADRGVGFLVNVARGLYDTALVFVGVAVLVVMALALFGIVALLERRFCAWREAGPRG